MRESQIQSEIIDFLRNDINVALVVRINSGMRGTVPFNYWFPVFWETEELLTAEEYEHRLKWEKRQTSGVSDLMVFRRDGKPVVIETKADKGKLRDAQAVFLERAAQAGVSVMTPNSYDDFIRQWQVL